MTPSLQKILEEFDNSDIVKRLNSVEICAQNHGFAPYQGQTIKSFICSHFEALEKEAREEMKEEILGKRPKPKTDYTRLCSNCSFENEDIGIGYNQCLKEITELITNLK